MLSYLTKFNELPDELREKISSPEIMQAITDIEKKYDISLATLIMRIMVKEISVLDLEKYFVFEYNLNGEQARAIVDELKEKVLSAAGDYLGLKTENKSEINLNKWVEQRKEEAAAIQSSNFFFSAEDEEEVASLAKKIAVFKKEEPQVAAIAKEKEDEYAEKIIKDLGISFSSEDLKNRFCQIMKTYWREIRNRIDTKGALLKGVDFGGMGMDINLIDKVIKSADEIKSQELPATPDKPAGKVPVAEDISSAMMQNAVKSENGISKKADINPGINAVRDVGYDFSKLAKKSEPEISNAGVAGKTDIPSAPAVANNEAFTNQKKTETISSPPAAPKPPTAEGNLNGADSIMERAKRIAAEANIKVTDAEVINVQKKENETQGGMISDIKIVNLRRPAPSKGKTRVEDVKFVPKLIGPIDELREMDLVNFRRLSENSTDAAVKIKEKINFLEEDSFAQRLEGIKAWRQSPINKLYLEIGQQSIANKLPINAIIGERLGEEKESLSLEEFNAVMELNKDLRY